MSQRGCAKKNPPQVTTNKSLGARAKSKTERGGFEPPVPFLTHSISSAAQSAALPPLQITRGQRDQGDLARTLFFARTGVLCENTALRFRAARAELQLHSTCSLFNIKLTKHAARGTNSGESLREVTRQPQRASQPYVLPLPHCWLRSRPHDSDVV